LPPLKQRKRGKQAFEKTHERITLWIDSNLKRRFESLADDQGVAKSTLLDEAISTLLEKYEV
jgi:predicted transcriptional regulator